MNEFDKHWNEVVIASNCTEDEARIHFEAGKASVNREGFVLVPVEPTNRMHKAGNNLINSKSGYIHDAGSIWESMIKASQENKDE
jgi:hypothetical protein